MCAPRAEAALSQRLWVLRRYPVLELGKRRQQSGLTTGTSPTALSPACGMAQPRQVGTWLSCARPGCEGLIHTRPVPGQVLLVRRGRPCQGPWGPSPACH